MAIRTFLKVMITVVGVGMLFISAENYSDLDSWTQREKALIANMNIELLPAVQDPSNKYLHDKKAAELGSLIFNDTRFSANGKISCATCHKEDYNFTDNLKLAKGLGELTRRSMPLEGVAHQDWFFWDGRADALWAQVLVPMENPQEQGFSRLECFKLIKQEYKLPYEEIFGSFPVLNTKNLTQKATPAFNDVEANSNWDNLSLNEQDTITSVFVNMGKSLAAFIATLQPKKAPIDTYAHAITNGSVKGLNALNTSQKKGLRIFLNDGGCVSCHNGPLLTNSAFHHVGIPDFNEQDRGRAMVVTEIEKNEFGCTSKWSDTERCDETKYRNQDIGRNEAAFKTPSLRNVATRAPYMHAGQFSTLKEVLVNYRNVSGIPPVDEIFHNELTNEDLEHLEAFLYSLNSINN